MCDYLFKALNEKAEDITTSINDKEDLFENIDKMTGRIDEKIEEILETIRPEAFAVVKETSRRWAENGKLEVTAQDFDIELSTKKDGITIENGKAIWHNEWTAAGVDINWNMVHYDVQLTLYAHLEVLIQKSNPLVFQLMALFASLLEKLIALNVYHSCC